MQQQYRDLLVQRHELTVGPAAATQAAETDHTIGHRV
jgi:hypothetical protein